MTKTGGRYFDKYEKNISDNDVWLKELKMKNNDKTNTIQVSENVSNTDRSAKKQQEKCFIKQQQIVFENQKV